MIVADENPRKKLYTALTTHKDPNVSEYFKQYQFDEFEKKLTTDKTAQEALFQELRGLKMTNNRNEFLNTYVNVPAEKPAAAAATAPAAVAPTSPEVVAQSKPVEAAPKTGSSRIAYEKIGEDKTSTASKILSGIGKGVDMITSPIAAAVNFTSGLIKGAKATPVTTGYKDQKTGEITEPTTKLESAAIQFGKQYDPIVTKRVEATQTLESAKKGKSDYLDWAKKNGIAPTVQAEKIKEYDNAIGSSEIILNSTKADYEQKFLQFDDRMTEWATEEAKNAPQEAFMKDGSGFEVPKDEFVTAKANKLAEKMGIPVGQYTYKLMKDKLTQQMSWSKMEPEYKQELDSEFKKLSGGLTLTQSMQKELEQGSTPAVSQKKAQIEYDIKAADIIKQRDKDIDFESTAYKTTIGGLQEVIKNDAEIKSSIDVYDKKTFDPLQALVSEGKLSAEEANKMLNSPESKKVREEFIDAQVAKKYGAQMTEAFDKYLSKVSELNNSAQRKAKVEADAIYNAYKKKADQSGKAVQTKYKPSSKILENYRKASDIALKKVTGKSQMNLRKTDIEKNFWNQFVGSTINGLGKGISSTAFLFNLRNIGNFGDILASQNRTSDLMIEGWGDWGLDKESLTKFINTVGTQGGQMIPSMAATIAVATATRGLGTTSLLSRLLATSIPQWTGATMQIAGQAKQDVFTQTGDVAKAEKAAYQSVLAQTYAYPAYLLTGLKYFSDAGKILMPIGTLGKYATGVARPLVQAGAEVVGETIEEITENANADAILKGKDPNFANVMKAMTLENASKTMAQVGPLSLLMGGAPAVYQQGKANVNQMIAGGFYAKNILGKVSNPALLKENQVQWLIKLYQDKGEGFAGGMLGTMLQRGDIDKKRAQVLAQKLDNYKNFSEIKAIQDVENPLVKQTAFVLYDKYQEAKNSGNREAEAAALENYNRYMSGKGAELVMVRMPDGDYQVYSYEDFNSLMDSKEFQTAASKNEAEHGGVFEITPLIQTNEELQNPKLQQILGRFDAIQNSEPEAAPKKQADAPQVSDDEILQAQKRTGFQVPTLMTVLPQEYAAVMDAVSNKERGVTPDEIKEATRYLYDLRKIYANMATSSSRNLTTDQIQDFTNELTDALNQLSDYKDNLSYDEKETPEPEDNTPTVPGPSAQEVAAQSLEEKVAADIKAGRFANATFNSEAEIPEALLPYMERAVRFKQDGVTKIQITAPASLIEQPVSNVQEGTLVSEEPVVEAPVAEEAPVVEEAPAVEPTPEPTTEKPQEPAKPKAKINLFTDDDAVGSFNQRQLETYEKLLFDGEDDMAKQMVNAQKQRMVNREVEQVERGEISEKVKAFYEKFGIGIETLSADEFVKMLKENGESALRTQEGVFDDKNGKIYINKDAFDLGFGTTVIWHEAIHPIMNIIHNSNKPLYDKIHRGIEAAIKANPKGGLADVKKWVDTQYTDAKGYNDASRKDELIVEAIARLSAGTLSFNELQPTLRQQFKDLINRIAKILGLSNTDTDDIKALKDLAKKITTEIKKGGEGNLSAIVGLENVGKIQRPTGLTTQARAGAATSVKDIDVKNIRTLARPGNRVSKGLAIYSRDNKKIVEEAPDLSIEYVKEKAPEIFISNSNIISKFPIVSGVQKFGEISTVEDAQKVYDIFIREIADNLKFLMDEFNPEFREVSTLWYDGANILAQNLAQKYPISVEQAAAMIACLSPQKDWYQNVRLAEMVMMAFDENPDMTKKMVDKQKLINIEGQKTDNPKIRKAEKAYNEALANYAANPNKENRAAVKAAKDNVKKQKDALAKKIVAGKKLIERLNGLVGKRMNDVPNNMKAYYTRLWNEINTTKDYDVLRPDGVVIGPAYKNDGKKARVAWGSYGEISKAVAVYLDGSQENITRTLGEMHKIRNFNNNIIDPMSQDNDVTMDTHAIAAALLMALSGKAKQVTQNFGTGTSNSGALGIKGLYYAYAEAYILAAKEVGLLPRQVQSITWEAVRGLFTDTYKNKAENVKKINDIWNDYSNGKLSIDETRRAILQEAGGINDPTWSGPVQAESGVDTEQGSVGGRGKGVGRVPVGRDTGRGGKRGSVPKSQSSLGGRDEQAGDGGGRNIIGAETPLAGAPNVQGATGPDPNLVDIARRYALKAGIPYRRQSEYVKVDPERGARIADAYNEMKHDPQNPKVKEAYADLIRQTKDQYQALVDDGYEFTFFDGETDPYDSNPSNAMRDLRANKRMAVYGTYAGYGTEGITGAAIEDNPMLGDTGLKWPDQKGVMHDVTANDLFRAVHDAFGHGLEGSSFRARGEENAWQAHIRLFTGPAIAAITSETRGQNSWLNFGPYGEANRTAKVNDTIFAEQKVGLMPEWTWTEGLAPDMEEPGMQASQGGRQEAPSFSDLDKVLDMSPVKSRAARAALVEQYGKETVDKMIEISRNFEKIINDLEEREVVKKDCP